MYNSLWPHGLYSPWNSPGQNTGLGSQSLIQWIFPKQKLNWGLLHCRRILYQLGYEGSLEKLGQHIKKQRHYLPTEVHLVKTMVYPVIMYGCESWTIKKAEHWRIDAFELWCWRKLLRVPWTVRRSNQSILKEVSPEYSSEGLMLNTFATWCEELTSWKRPWCWERLKSGGKGDKRGWDGWMASLTLWIEFE